MSDCCLIKKVATVEVYENKNEVRAYGFMAGDRNTPVMEVRFKHLWGESNLSTCKLRWIIVDDVGSLLVGEVPIQSDNTALINLPNELFTGDRRMKVQLTVASCDGNRILNLQQFTDLKVINSLAPNEVVEPVYQLLINTLYDEAQSYLKQLEDSYTAKYGSLENLYSSAKASLEQYLINAENGGNAEFLQGYNPKNFNRVENTINELINSAGSKYKVGDVVEVLGYYTAGDGAHHKRKIESADDGSGVQLANGLWANIVTESSFVNISHFGANDTTDFTPIFNKAYAFAVNKNKNIEINKGSYICYTYPLEIDPRGRCTDLKNSTINVSENFVGSLFQLKIESQIQNTSNSSFKNMEILGNSSGTCLDLFTDHAWKNIAGLQFENISIRKFGKAVDIKSNIYIVGFKNCAFASTVSMPSGYSNYGERINFDNCTFFNQSLCIEMGNMSGGFMHFNNCSFDYSQQLLKCTGGTVLYSQCHFETDNQNQDTDKPWFDVDIRSGYALVDFSDCILMGAGKNLNRTSIWRINGAKNKDGDGIATLNVKNSRLFGLRFTGGYLVDDVSGFANINFQNNNVNRVHNCSSLKVSKAYTDYNSLRVYETEHLKITNVSSDKITVEKLKSGNASLVIEQIKSSSGLLAYSFILSSTSEFVTYFTHTNTFATTVNAGLTPVEVRTGNTNNDNLNKTISINLNAMPVGAEFYLELSYWGCI